jgi:hypothetical protein
MKKTSIVVLLNACAAIACLGLQAGSLGLTLQQAFLELPWGSFLTGLSVITDANASVGSTDLLATWLVIAVAGIAIQAIRLLVIQRAALGNASEALPIQVTQPAHAEPKSSSDKSNDVRLNTMTDQVSDPALREELLRLEAALSKLAASGRK